MNLVLVLKLKLNKSDYSIQIMVEIGIVEIIGLGAPLGIIGTMLIVLYFSRKQAQGFTLDIETKVLNDLDEKVRKMAEIIIEKPSLQKVIYKLEKPSEELAFATYILFISSHAYSMRQRNVLKDDEWAGWLQWMRNCFKYGTTNISGASRYQNCFCHIHHILIELFRFVGQKIIESSIKKDNQN
jgi:hypothetical protein